MAVTVNGKCLEEMKYHDLQKIAKSVGIPAKGKIDKLVKSLTLYYKKQHTSQDQASPKQRPKKSLENCDDDIFTGKIKQLPPKITNRLGTKVSKAEAEEGMDFTESAEKGLPSKTAKSTESSPDTAQRRQAGQEALTPKMKSVLSSQTNSASSNKQNSHKRSRLSGKHSPRKNSASGRKLNSDRPLTPQMKLVLSGKRSPRSSSASSSKRNSLKKSRLSVKRSPRSGSASGRKQNSDRPLTPQMKLVLSGKRSPRSSSASSSKRNSPNKKARLSGKRSPRSSSASSSKRNSPNKKARLSGKRSPRSSSASSSKRNSPNKKARLSGKRSPRSSSASSNKQISPNKKARLSGKDSAKTSSTSGRNADRQSGHTPQMKSIPSGKNKQRTSSVHKRKRSTSRQEDTVPGTSFGEPSAKRNRRSTFDKTPTKETGVDILLDSMKEHMDSAERKKCLMTAIDSNVKAKSKNDTPKTKADENSKKRIPRFAAFVEQNKDSQKKPITPGNKDWKKIHDKEFSKFDSIDVYLEKKKKRNQVITESVKKAREVLNEAKDAVSRLKSMKTPNNENKSMKNKNRNSNAYTSSKLTPFKPVVLKTKSMNLNFNKTPQKFVQVKCDNGTQEKFGSTKAAALINRKSLGSFPQTSTTSTPFTFTAIMNKTVGALNTSVASSKKSAFDLKASLSRPITWKTHKGKLKPMPDLNEPQYLYSQLGNKTPKIKTRDDRRKAVVTRRAEKKIKSQMKRRGIVS